MAYIGKTPTIGNFQVCDAISVVNGQAAYTMQVGSVNVSPESANHMLVSLNGILQKPGSSFTVSSSTITFASNLVTGDVIDFIQILGNVLDLGVPSDSTVSLAKLTATGTKSSSTFLRGDNTFASAGITMADQWRITANHTSSGDITSNWERTDNPSSTILLSGGGMTESSGVFTFPSTGIYLILATTRGNRSSVVSYAGIHIEITTNNSSYSNMADGFSSVGQSNYYFHASAQLVFDVSDTSTHKLKLLASADGAANFSGDSNVQMTGATFIRLGDT